MSEDPYAKDIIKDYKYWTVYLHGNQGYLGRCVIWCKREDALDLTEATPEEQQELFYVLNDLKQAVSKAFDVDWHNYAFLGNETRHLHGHYLPRYEHPREFEGSTFVDERWGHNYQTNHDFKIPEETFRKIQNKIKEFM